MHHVMALVIPDVVVFDLSIPAQIFGHPDERDAYSFRIAAYEPGIVAGTTGFGVHAEHGLDVLEHADTIIVPGYESSHPLPEPTLEALRAAYARGTRIVSVCTGAFALAAAGLLDGRRATTHWRATTLLTQQYPNVSVDPAVLYVDEGQVSTSAGIAAGIDLCLHLVRGDLGQARASRIARRMVVPPHRDGGQAQYIEHPLPPQGEGLAPVYAWALTHLADPITIDGLAGIATMSKRTFIRRFTAETGTTPLAWITGQRIHHACHLLETTALSIDEIADASGLGSAANLRLHLARTKHTPLPLTAKASPNYLHLTPKPPRQRHAKGSCPYPLTGKGYLTVSRGGYQWDGQIIDSSVVDVMELVTARKARIRSLRPLVRGGCRRCTRCRGSVIVVPVRLVASRSVRCSR